MGDATDLQPTSTHADAASEKRAWLEGHGEGYEKGLKPRQVQMIAVGGAIGTGLFLGAGGRLQTAGPSLAIVYLVCGGFSFLILRALGELVMHRPTSGSFVSYAREFLGERASFVAGWLYFLNWAMTGIVDITAVALYMHYWGTFADTPQWLFALVALGIVGVIMNMVGVKWFGEMEFWFSLIKVAALPIIPGNRSRISNQRSPGRWAGHRPAPHHPKRRPVSARPPSGHRHRAGRGVRPMPVSS